MHRAARTFFISMVAFLLVLGLTMLYSTTYDVYGETLLLRQLVWIVIGTGGALLINIFDYRKLSKYSTVLLAGLAVALTYLAVANLLHHQQMPESARILARNLPFVSGLHVGSARWLGVGNLRFQPSEFATLAIILFLALYFSSHSRHLHTFHRGFFKPMAIVGSVVLLILLGGDLSTTAITGTMIFGLCFVAGVRLRFLSLIVILGAVMVLAALYFSPGRMDRLLYYRNPEKYQSHETYQLWSSQLAIGSGGWGGLGFTESRMKRRYLPEAHTDFIIAIIGEELGFIGLTTVILMYAGMIFSVLWIGAMAVDRQGVLICCGVALALGLRAFVNIGVVSGFLPTTGVTAPLISYGGSNAVASLLGIGLALNVGRIAAQARTESDSAKLDIAGPPPHDISHRDLLA